VERPAEHQYADPAHQPGRAAQQLKEASVSPFDDQEMWVRADALTGAMDRPSFLRQVDQAALDHKWGDPPAVLVIDLDDFAGLNDVLGYRAGDRVLVAVADLLRTVVPDDGTVGRLDGDQFGVLLPDVGERELAAVAERVRAAVAGPIEANGDPVSVRSSIGVAHGAAGDRGSDLLSQADAALRTAQAGHRGRPVHYEPRMKARLLDQAALLEGLHEAVEGGQLELVYQPVVQLGDGTLTGLEALARWRHPVRGPIMPGDFIPIAERSGLIVPLGRWMLAEVCRQQGADWPMTFVNTSAHQLREPGFADAVAELAADPARLVIEVTEDALADQTVVNALRAVREHGVRVAVDDFGTGPASLPALANAPIDVLKVHGSVAAQVITSPRSATVARAIAELAGELGIVAIAKAVESAAQAERLYELGYREGMGFHFAVPQPATAVPLFIGAGESFLAALA
jgi:diguanylate cyclase (GGDEF)-like protein